MSQRFDVLVSDLCEEIDMLRDELKTALAAEKAWRDKYSNLVLQDIKHGQQMMGGILMLALHNNITPIHGRDIRPAETASTEATPENLSSTP